MSNDIGRHGMAVLARREGIDLDIDIQSDVALLSPLIQALLQADIELHCARDLTRGGLGGAVLELAGQSGWGMLLDESRIPVLPPVAAASELLGFDPLFIANEGCCVLFLPQQQVQPAPEILQAFGAGRWAATIGRVTADDKRVRIKPFTVSSGRCRGIRWISCPGSADASRKQRRRATRPGVAAQRQWHRRQPGLMAGLGAERALDGAILEPLLQMLGNPAGEDHSALTPILQCSVTGLCKQTLHK
ncbi:MAG: AIR synthase-related protein [Gammaproteobacteria bacterium]